VFNLFAFLASTAVFGEAPASAVNTDMVLRWNEATLRAIKVTGTPPPQAARHLAMVHIAIFDAVNSVNPTYRSFRFPFEVRVSTSAPAAAATAAHRVLVELYPARIAVLGRLLDESLQPIPESDSKAAGVALGQSVAQSVLAWRQSDGSTKTETYAAGQGPGQWRPTPPGLRAPLLPHWRLVTPFGGKLMPNTMPPEPPAMTSEEYLASFKEVKSIGSRDSLERSKEQTLIALFWDDSERSVTPPGHWNRIAQEASRSRGLGLVENARLFALLNICLADAAVLCWECKFRHAVWRPITAIREANKDANPDTTQDADWTPLLITPPFPSYTSGHSTFSGAAAAALEQHFGTDAIPFTIGSDGIPGVRRSFDGFWAAALEAGRSRIYGGIHYEFDNRAGLASGKALAEAICRTLLRPVIQTEVQSLPPRR
jgi:hypothetical protein